MCIHQREVRESERERESERAVKFGTQTAVGHVQAHFICKNDGIFVVDSDNLKHSIYKNEWVI